MSLSDKRCLFTRLLCTLILRMSMRGISLAFGEGYVALTDAADGDHDGPHKRGGAHYTGIGMDLIMYRTSDGREGPITDGSDSEWLRVGQEWERMDSLCRWGGRFSPPDANHFSLLHDGRA